MNKRWRRTEHVGEVGWEDWVTGGHGYKDRGLGIWVGDMGNRIWVREHFFGDMSKRTWV